MWLILICDDFIIHVKIVNFPFDTMFCKYDETFINKSALNSLVVYFLHAKPYFHLYFTEFVSL